MSRYNASLSFKGDTNRRFGIWVMEYSQDHNLAGSTAQSKWFRHFYPRSYSPGPIRVTGRVDSQYNYDRLIEFIRDHQEVILNKSGGSNITGASQASLLRLEIPSENIYVRGWIEAIKGGAQRFNVAPEFTFEFKVITDSHSKDYELIPSYAMRAWWSGAMVKKPGKIQDKNTSDDNGDLGSEVSVPEMIDNPNLTPGLPSNIYDPNPSKRSSGQRDT